MPVLNAGDRLPDLALKVGKRDSINLPADIESDYAVILFYRGHW